MQYHGEFGPLGHFELQDLLHISILLMILHSEKLLALAWKGLSGRRYRLEYVRIGIAHGALRYPIHVFNFCCLSPRTLSSFSRRTSS